MNVIIIVLTVAIGSTMSADSFLTFETIEIVVLGLIAFVFGTGSGVVGAKIMNLFLKEKINPLLGSAGIASVPIAARVSHNVALEYDKENYLIYHAMGPNLAGVFGTAISGAHHACAARRQVGGRRSFRRRHASDPTGLPIPPAPGPSRRPGSTRHSGRPGLGACSRCSRSRSRVGCRRPDCRARNRHGPS